MPEIQASLERLRESRGQGCFQVEGVKVREWLPTKSPEFGIRVQQIGATTN
jgi:hypothetical protein